MREIVALLFRRKLPVIVSAVAVAAAILLFIASLWSLGLLSSVAYDDGQNTEFADALQAQPPPAAIKEAAAAAGPEFAARIRSSLKTSANELLRSEDAAESFAETRPSEPKARAWNDEYVCGLQGWGVHRPVMRKLLLSGYGDCGAISRFHAGAPALYRNGGLGGWLVTLVPPILLMLLIIGAIRLALARKAYFWLYESRMRG